MTDEPLQPVDRVSTGLTGLDEVLDVVSAVENEEFELLLGRQPPLGHRLSKFHSVVAAGGLSAAQRDPAGLGQRVGKALDLRAFSCPVDPFEDDE